MEIVSIGRYDLLIAVLNGLAMLTSDAGPAGYGGMVALGLMVGVILTLVRGVVTQKLELQWILAGWLLYACLFVPKVTVTVRDIYTGATNAVDNVPLGPALIGTITSQVGVHLADAFGSVFAFPSITNGGYLDTLDLIDAFNKMDYGDANDGRIGNAGLGLGADPTTIDTKRSLNNYLADCTLYSMTMNLPGTSVTWAKLREAPDLLAAIRVDSNTWFTTMYLADGVPNGTVVTCTTAYNALANFITQRFLPAWQTEIGKKLKLPSPDVQIQAAVDSVLGIGRDRQTFMINVLIKKQMELSELGYHARSNNAASLIMRTQAMEQRRVQWASEQSLFQEMARPLMGYIEAFFYAVSPITAFTFLLGAVGITLFGRYLLLAIWIQLWMPIMAINNLYVSMAAAERIQSIGAGGFDPLSMVGLDSVWTQTQSWLATGGVMAGATPLLSLMLVTGSYFAFTSLTNRMSGGDHINEKIAAPDIMAPAAFTNVGAMGMQQAQFTHDPYHGLHKTGAVGLIPSINVSRGISSAVQSRASFAEDASERYVRDSSIGGSLTRTQDTAGFIQNYTSQQGSSRVSHADQFLSNMGRSVVQDDQRFNRMTQEQKAAFNGALSLGLSGLGNGATIGNLLQQATGKDEGLSKVWAERLDKVVSHGENKVVDFARAMATDEQEGVRGQFVTALGVRDENKWSQSATTTLQAIRSYDEISSLTQMRGVQQSIDTLAIARAAQEGGWFNELVGLASKHGLYNDKMQEKVATFMQGLGEKANFHGIDQQAAFGIKLAESLGEGSVDGQTDLARLLNKHGFFSTRADLGDPAANIGIKEKMEGSAGLPNAASIRSDVENRISKTTFDPEAIRGRIDSKLEGFGQPGSSEVRERGDDSVNSFQKDELSRNERLREYEQRKLSQEALLEKAQQIRKSWKEDRGISGYMTESGLSNIARGMVLPDDRDKVHQEALSYAHVQGLPQNAAEYFATERAIPYEVGERKSAYDNHKVPEHNQLRKELESQFTPLGVQILQRAAESDDNARDKYVAEAMTLYKANQIKVYPKGPMPDR